MLYYFLSSPKEIRKFSQNFRLKTWEDEPNHKPLNSSGYKPQIRALELHSRAAPSVEAHYRVSGPKIGRDLLFNRFKMLKTILLINLKLNVNLCF